MKTSNYRVIQRDDGSYGLALVYYNQLGEACGMQEDEAPVTVALQDAERDALVAQVERTQVDARTRPIFVVPSKWAPDDVAASLGSVH